MALEEVILGLTAAVQQNTAILERVIGNQNAAIATMEADKKPATPRKKAADKAQEAAAEGNATNAATAQTQAGSTETPNSAPAAANEPAKQVWSILPSYDQKTVGEWANPWIVEATDPEVRKERGQFLLETLQHLGAGKLSEIADDETRKQFVFFIHMKREGLTVNFNADYDFDVDPLTQGEPQAAEPEAVFDPLA